MNVLMFVSWYTPQGSERLQAGVFHHEQSMALREHANVCLYHPFDDSIPAGTVTCQEEWGLLTYRSGMCKNPIHSRKLIYSTFDRIVREFKPDVIHTHVALAVSRFAIVYGKKHNIPVIVSEHLPLEMMHFESRKNRLLAGFVYKNSAFNGCCSNQERDDLRRTFPKLQFDTIFNGIVPMTQELSQERFALDGRVNMCIVAAFYDQFIKGYQYLLPAIKQVAERNPHICLHIVGGGEYLEHYQKMAEDLEIGEFCRFYGNCTRDKVYSIVSQMDFGISASIMEAAGVSIEEQMLLGLPVLVTRSGGCNSLVTEQTAIVVDKGSTQALADGILQMLEQYKQFDRDAIREYAQDHFSMEKVTKTYLELYRSILEGSK